MKIIGVSIAILLLFLIFSYAVYDLWYKDYIYTKRRIKAMKIKESLLNEINKSRHNLPTYIWCDLHSKVCNIWVSDIADSKIKITKYNLLDLVGANDLYRMFKKYTNKPKKLREL